MEFLEMMNALCDVQDALPVDSEIAANENNGIVTVSFYAGLENTKMFNGARQLLANIR